MSDDSAYPLDHEPTARALAAVVAHFGPSVIYSPPRLRASLADSLGVLGRQHRAEVDAIVLSAEEGIAAAVATDGRSPAELKAVLLQRGLSEDMAMFTIAAWQRALGAPQEVDKTVRRASLMPSGSAGVDSAAPAGNVVAPAKRQRDDDSSRLGRNSSSDEVTSAAQQSAAEDGLPLRTTSRGAERIARRRGKAFLPVVLLVPPMAVLSLIGFGVAHRSDTSKDAAAAVQGSFSTLPEDAQYLALGPDRWTGPVPYAWTGSDGCRTQVPNQPPASAKRLFTDECGVRGPGRRR